MNNSRVLRILYLTRRMPTSGAVTTATVIVQPGLAAVQGTQPRLAVEGYISGTLIGGVVLDVLVPIAAFFDGKLRVYLPIIMR